MEVKPFVNVLVTVIILKYLLQSFYHDYFFYVMQLINSMYNALTIYSRALYPNFIIIRRQIVVHVLAYQKPKS